mmetsp:Transcript_46923/g.149825  ORF Transcript_46923/g.149825 Transcript_46923/m.149825 type:complete len:318 (-) Transcript_46923:11-964(-)
MLRGHGGPHAAPPRHLRGRGPAALPAAGAAAHPALRARGEQEAGRLPRLRHAGAPGDARHGPVAPVHAPGAAGRAPPVSRAQAAGLLRRVAGRKEPSLRAVCGRDRGNPREGHHRVEGEGQEEVGEAGPGRCGQRSVGAGGGPGAPPAVRGGLGGADVGRVAAGPALPGGRRGGQEEPRPAAADGRGRAARGRRRRWRQPAAGAVHHRGRLQDGHGERGDLEGHRPARGQVGRGEAQAVRWAAEGEAAEEAHAHPPRGPAERLAVRPRCHADRRPLARARGAGPVARNRQTCCSCQGGRAAVHAAVQLRVSCGLLTS